MAAPRWIPQQETARAPLKVFFLVTEDWYFWSHRLPLAREAKARGFDVGVLTRVAEYEGKLLAEGFRIFPIGLRRERMNPVAELRAIAEIYTIYQCERPAIVHQVGVKPVIYGSIAARLAGVRHVVNALGGLGYVFSSGSARARILRPLVRTLLPYLVNRSGSQLILQTEQDRKILEESGVDPRHVVVIRGAGVDMRLFRPVPESASAEALVVLPARMLWDKGVGDFVTACELLRARGVRGRFALVGAPDAGNPASIEVARLNAWSQTGVVEWWGRADDMPAVLGKASVVCLPTVYGEGVPKVLIEAAAAGRAIVTTNLSGCRDVVRDWDNGLLVPPHNPEALADALQRLIEDPSMRRRMGERGRAIAESGFAVEHVVEQTFEVYERLLMKSKV